MFLNLTAYFIAPYVAVLLMDYYAGPRRDRSRLPELYDRGRVLEWGAVAWVVGTLSSVPFWNSSLYTGFVAENHPEWGEVSYYVGFVVGALVYLLTRRLPPLWHRSPGRPAAGAALPAGNTPKPRTTPAPGPNSPPTAPGPRPDAVRGTQPPAGRSRHDLPAGGTHAAPALACPGT